MGLHLHELTKRYVGPDGSVVPVIDVPRFDLGDGEQVALVGGSGTGKTTLLHLIAGILTPDAGQIVYDNLNGQAGAATDIARLGESDRDVFRGRYVGYIFQTHHLLSGFTALENVLLGMSFTGRSSDPAWAKHLLTEVGLSDRLNYKPEKTVCRAAAARRRRARPGQSPEAGPRGRTHWRA